MLDKIYDWLMIIISLIFLLIAVGVSATLLVVLINAVWGPL